MISNCVEQWKAVPGYEGRYEVSDLGRVRSLRLDGGRADTLRDVPKVLRQFSVGLGYLGVDLWGRRYSTHYLVLAAFVSPRPDGMECRHLNCVRSDNRLSNLAWGTRKENRQDSILHGTIARGERHSGAKLTDRLVQEIRMASTENGSGVRLAELFGVSTSRVCAIRNGRTWKHLPVMEKV